MISKINVNTNQNNSKSPSFKAGPLDGATWLLQQCNAIPMVGVSVIDGTTAIIPRTIVDAKTNGFAAAETFRRESSGLVVNCLIPGFFVLGAAKLIELFKPAYKGLSGLWANQDSLKEIHTRWAKAKNSEEFVKGIIKDLEVNVGKNWVSANMNDPKIKQAQSLLKEIIDGTGSKTKKDLKEVNKLFNEALKGSEHIRFSNGKGTFSSNLSVFLRDTVDCSKIFKNLKPEEFKNFFEKAVKFTNAKSLAGLAVIIPLAASVQSINRWITRKTSGKEGAPIYKDFIKEDTKKHMTEKEKSKFLLQRIGAAALMAGTAILSMMKKPSLKMIQFNNILPSMDQCRWIAMATFASRMLVAEDQNELREVTFRDIATFCSLYFFGDYVSKGVGSLIKKTTKGRVDLMNYLKEAPDTKNIFKKFKHWVVDTKLKTFDEAGVISKEAKNMRSLCEISSLGFSMLLLGILVPWYVRKQTEIQRKKEVEANMNRYHTYPTIFPLNISEKRAFQAFGMLEEKK